ncbi:MerR family DNA-binding protein [Amycolatopsis taiwanensis]|nr:MerR family DNA-binding protein [Amycolatopsis taiwanensis]
MPTPPRDRAGQRSYRNSDLRDLAFILMCRDGGLRLDEIAALMGRATSPSPHRWQDIVADRLTAIEADLARLREAHDYLSNALRCQAEHPAVECPYVQRELDDRVAGMLPPDHP